MSGRWRSTSTRRRRPPDRVLRLRHLPLHGLRSHGFSKTSSRSSARISDEVWATKPDATIVVYPHYFSGPRARLRRQGGEAALRPSLVALVHPAQRPPRASTDRAGEGAAFGGTTRLPGGDPREIRARCPTGQACRAMTGYVPSLEAYSFVATGAEEGQAWLKGRRQVPLGFGWLAPGEPPYDELPMRVNRIAYREFSQRPRPAVRSLTRRSWAGRSSESWPPRKRSRTCWRLQAVFAIDRTWCQPSPVVSPDRVRAMASRGEVDAAEAGRVPGRCGIACGPARAAPWRAEVGRRAAITPHCPLGPRPMGSREREAARPLTCVHSPYPARFRTGWPQPIRITFRLTPDDS